MVDVSSIPNRAPGNSVSRRSGPRMASSTTKVGHAHNNNTRIRRQRSLRRMFVPIIVIVGIISALFIQVSQFESEQNRVVSQDGTNSTAKAGTFPATFVDTPHQATEHIDNLQKGTNRMTTASKHDEATDITMNGDFDSERKESRHERNVNRTDDKDEDFFGACLLVMDDVSHAPNLLALAPPKSFIASSTYCERK